MAIKIITYKEQSFQLSYELINITQKKIILILHGWGSNKEIMRQSFHGTFPTYKHIYLDLPGFGKSSNDIILTTVDYVKIVQLFLDTLGVKPSISMGHSFGGKIATLLNSPYLILLASSGIRVPKVLKVRVKISLFKFLKPIKLDRLHQFFAPDDANGMKDCMYETFKNVVYEEFENNFTEVKSKTLLFWGESDTATPLWSGQKIAGLINDSKLYPLSGDHFFFIEHKDFISQVIDEYCH